MRNTNKVLVVEDEIVIAKDIKMTLEDYGYNVVGIVTTGKKALKMVEETRPDLVCMDIALDGEMDGIEAAGIINSKFGVPSIYITAHADEKILERAKKTGPFGYLMKPFQNKELHASIQMALYKHKAQKEQKKIHQNLQIALDKATQEIKNRIKTETIAESSKIEIISKNKELEQILSTTIHDLRTPMLNIQGFTEEVGKAIKDIKSIIKHNDVSNSIKMKLSPILEKNIPEAINYILISTNKMDALILGLIQVSRLGQIKLDITPLDINNIFSNAEKNMKYKLNQVDAILEIDELPPCLGDINLINQAFSNLLQNSLKYLNPKRPGIIKITGQREGRKTIYCIEDNGIGISLENQKKIFKIFHRINPKSTEGDGLGLYIVNKIINKHDGKVWVESEPDKGSMFFVSLKAV